MYVTIFVYHLIFEEENTLIRKREKLAHRESVLLLIIPKKYTICVFG